MIVIWRDISREIMLRLLTVFFIAEKFIVQLSISFRSSTRNVMPVSFIITFVC